MSACSHVQWPNRFKTRVLNALQNLKSNSRLKCCWPASNQNIPSDRCSGQQKKSVWKKGPPISILVDGHRQTNVSRLSRICYKMPTYFKVKIKTGLFFDLPEQSKPLGSWLSSTSTNQIFLQWSLNFSSCIPFSLQYFQDVSFLIINNHLKYSQNKMVP